MGQNRLPLGNEIYTLHPTPKTNTISTLPIQSFPY